MRDRRAPLEIIEVLAPDDLALDAEVAAPAAPVTATAPRPRHRGLAAIAVVAALAFGGWVVAGGDDDSSDAVATTTTEARPQLAPDAATDGHFLLLADSLRPYSADIVTEPSERAIFRLWGTTSADQPWWSVQALPGSLDDFFFVNAVRTSVDGTDVIQRVGTNTLITLRDFGDGWVGVVTSSGLGGPVHVRLANDLRHEGTEIVESGTTSEGLGLRQVAAEAWESQWLYGDVTSQVRSIAADGTMVTLRVGAGAIADRRLALPYFTGGPAGFTGNGVNGHRRDTGESIVIWTEGDALLSLTAAMPIDQLEPLRDAVVAATAEEWSLRMYAATADYRVGDWYTLAEGTDDQGIQWSAGVQAARRGGRNLVLWWWRTPDGGTRSVEAPPNSSWSEPTTVVTRGATYVFVRTSPDDDGTIDVLDGNGALHVVEVQSAESLLGELFGATRLTTPGRAQFSTTL